MLTATNMFISSLEKWMHAVQAGDFDAAKFQANQMKMGGDLLVIRPEFCKCFAKHCEGFDPKQALTLMTCFLLCTIEGRAEAMKQKAPN